MRYQIRLKIGLLALLCVTALLATTSQLPASAQPIYPTVTQEPGPTESDPPGVDTTQQDPVATESAPPGVDQSVPPADVAPPVEAEQPVDPDVPAQETVLGDDWLAVALDARNDLELLATAQLGDVNRPGDWSGSFDINDPQFALLARLDLELLAGSLLGPDNRPEGWFGVVGSTSAALARDLRHDLELLADTVLDPAVGRPAGWVGGLPLMRCDRLTQAVVTLLETSGTYNVQADRTAADFCDEAGIEVSVFIETNLLVESTVTGVGVAMPTGTSVNTDFGVAFLDRSAVRKVGVIPNGTPFQAVSRSPVQFSNMMLIQGDGFNVFVDYLFTSISPDEFAVLPVMGDGTVDTFCTAEWCEG